MTLHYSILNVDKLPPPTLPDGALGMDPKEFQARAEVEEAYRNYVFPPDVQGYVLRKEHWARFAPTVVEETA